MFFYQISTLTADVDIINSTTNTTGKPTADARPGAGNDEFIAGGATPTLNPGDQLDGMGGTDTLRVYGEGNGLAGVTLNSIEKVYSYAGASEDVSKFADVQEYWVAGSKAIAAKIATTVNLATAVGIEGAIDGTNAADAVKFVFDGAKKGTDSINLKLNDAVLAGNAAGVTIADVEAINIEAAGESEIGKLTADKLETLTITGTGSVKATVDGANTALKTIDAAKNSGGVDLTLTTGDLVAAGTTITGGSGDDTISFTATTASVKLTVDLGAGKDTFAVNTGVAAGSTIKGGDGATDNDVISFVDGAHLTAAMGSHISGFEILKAATTGTYDYSLITGLKGLELGAGTSVVVSNLTAEAAANVLVSGAQGTGFTLGVKDASTSGQIDTVHLTVDDGLTTVSTIALNKATLTGVEKLHITANDNTSMSDFTAAASLTNITLDGAGTYSLITGATTFGLNTTIDATAAKGAVTINASNALATGLTIKGSLTATNTITGGAGADTITVGSGGSTITGGAGEDKITLGDGVDTVVLGTFAAAEMDTVSRFVSGTDVLNFAGSSAKVAAKSAGNFTDMVTYDSLAKVLATFVKDTGANRAELGANGAVSFTYDGAVYAVIGDGTAGYTTDDAVVKLAGIALESTGIDLNGAAANS